MIRGSCLFGHGEGKGDVCPRAMFELGRQGGFDLIRLMRGLGYAPPSRHPRGTSPDVDGALEFLRSEGCDRATLAHSQPNGGISVVFHWLHTGAQAPANFERRPAA
jgi:hypothetical protein